MIWVLVREGEGGRVQTPVMVQEGLDWPIMLVLLEHPYFVLKSMSSKVR